MIGVSCVQSEQCIQAIMKQMNSILIGKEAKIKQIMITLLAGGHLLLEDVPGVGKTTLANALAKSIHCSFGRIQFTPDTLPSDITGVSIYNMATGQFEYARGIILNQIVLADEINRTSPKTQASLLEAMEEKQVTVDGTTYAIESPFMVIATQNPIEFMGTYNLPEAQLDRFLMKISLGYPEKEQELNMVTYHLKEREKKSITPVAEAADIVTMQQEVMKVEVHKDLIEYLIELIQKTRNNENLILGASPRATLALIRASQACAYINGRTYVIPDDIQEVLYPVLVHRFVLSMEARMNKISSEEILKNIVRKTPVPILLNNGTYKR